uniref:Recep_L_domain domain-containing protein n=1 Tax=Strongyloides papillosus TaxID=174720 RepID=A0A0N5C4J4_STREA
MKHAKPAEPPAYMREDSLKICGRVENPDISELYEQISRPTCIVNATMFLDNIEDCPVAFPDENMPPLKRLTIINASYYSFKGTLSPFLEILAIENSIYLDTLIEYEELFHGLQFTNPYSRKLHNDQ